MFKYCEKCPCYGCPFDVCGRGSETCSAVIGDYCQATGQYIEDTEESIKFFEEITRKKNKIRG